MATSTPNEHIESLVRKYHLEYYINTGDSGIAEDWNFALAVTDKRIGFVRRRILSFGSVICCPSVTFIKENLPHPVFYSGYRSNVDWQAWEKISKLKGAFVYCDNILMYHRIHQESATTEKRRGIELIRVMIKNVRYKKGRMILQDILKDRDNNVNFMGLVLCAFLEVLEYGSILFLPYILIYVAFGTKKKLSYFGRKYEISYGMYLCAWPIQQTVVMLFGGNIENFLISIPMIIVAGFFLQILENRYVTK